MGSAEHVLDTGLLCDERSKVDLCDLVKLFAVLVVFVADLDLARSSIWRMRQTTFHGTTCTCPGVARDTDLQEVRVQDAEADRCKDRAVDSLPKWLRQG